MLNVPFQELRWNVRRLWLKRALAGKDVSLFGHAYSKCWDWGLALAALIFQLATRWGDAAPKVDIVAHSLGGRVVSSGLRRLSGPRFTAARHRVGRVIHLASAVSHRQVEALANEMAKAGAPPVELYNFTSSRDHVLRHVGAPLAHEAGAYVEERLLRAASPLMLLPMNLIRPRRILGVDGAAGRQGGLNRVDIPLEHPGAAAWGRGAGLDLAGELAECRMDHWVHYTHRGNRELYRRILSGDPVWSPEAIRSGKDVAGRAIRDPRSAGREADRPLADDTLRHSTPSFALMMAFTACGLALPPVAFIT